MWKIRKKGTPETAMAGGEKREDQRIWDEG